MRRYRRFVKEFLYAFVCEFMVNIFKFQAEQEPAKTKIRVPTPAGNRAAGRSADDGR
jgi:hypothetical protein